MFSQEQIGLPPTTDDPRALNDADPTKGIAAETVRLQDAGLPVTDENIFISASLKEKGLAFLKGEATIGVRKNVPEQPPVAPAAATNRYTVRVDDRAYDVVLEGDTARIDGHDYVFNVAENTPASAAAVPVPVATATEFRAELPGTVLRLAVAEGDTVSAGDALLVLEALKMEIEVKSPVDGTVAQLAVHANATVVAGDLLVAVA